MKSSVAERYQRIVDAAATRCREPVATVLTCQHVGAYGRTLGAIGGLASFKSRSARKAAGGLPDNVLLTLTSTRLHAFGFRPTMSGLMLGNALAGGAARAGRPRQNGDCRSGCAAHRSSALRPLSFLASAVQAGLA